MGKFKTCSAETRDANDAVIFKKGMPTLHRGGGGNSEVSIMLTPKTRPDHMFMLTLLVQKPECDVKHKRRHL